jgi:hypothetical protein
VTTVFLIALAVLAVIGFAVGPQPTTVVDALTGTTEGDTSPVGGGPTSDTIGTFRSDGSLTGSPITNDPATWPGAQPAYPNGAVWDICTAVALAEGFNQGVGTAPYDLNNPGDLSPGDEAEQATAGPAQYHGGSNIIFFATVEGGFVALYDKFFRIVSGNSKVYPASWTWAQVAKEYAGNSAAWLKNVTGYLGVDPASTPAQYAGLA